MLPFPNQQILRAINAQEELQAEVKRLQKIIKKLDALLSEKHLTPTQHDVLADLIYTVDVWRAVQEGNWAVPDHLHRHGKDK